MKIFFITLGFGLLVGCQPSDRTTTPAQVLKASEKNQDLIKYEDKEEGIICYSPHLMEAISCLYKK